MVATAPAVVNRQINTAVAKFEAERNKFETDALNLQNRLLGDARLRALIHSSKYRAKEPSHLRDKLLRKAEEARAKGRKFGITAGNLFDRVSDLAGVRLMHLHMRQMETIHPLIIEVLKGEGYVLEGRPEARTWDPEYAELFKRLGLKVKRDESLYTSVHYTVKQNTRTPRLCELQVRTLAEEIWGEVSHRINYPHETDSVACKEQLKVLARLVSGCTRLVDSIMASYAEHCRGRGSLAHERRRPLR